MKWQQGDVLIRAVAEFPEGGVRECSTVLATGEATGHSHRALGADRTFTVGAGRRQRLFIEASREVTIVHEEHGPISLPPGKFEVFRVREYDYFTLEPRSVRD